jgi:hypothetical protein
LETAFVKDFLNAFAVRCFRDMADGDYIAARMAYRARLVPQFLWASLQALEKYLKCILLLNRIKSNKATHDLAACLQKIEASAGFSLHLSNWTQHFIEYLDRYAKFRYLEVSNYLTGEEIWLLDGAVGEIRPYCWILHQANPRLSRQSVPPQELIRRFPGRLEEIVHDVKHPARKLLIWKNSHFGSRARKRLTMAMTLHAEDAPLALYPGMLDEVQKYVYVPRAVEDAYREVLKGQVKNH